MMPFPHCLHATRGLAMDHRLCAPHVVSQWRPLHATRGPAYNYNRPIILREAVYATA
jgi:hypothetical protein